MNITRAQTNATKRGPADYFTGVVWLDEVTSAPYSSDVRVVMVTFEPGARTAWHTHPHGQLLQITAGVGRVQTFGEAVLEVNDDGPGIPEDQRTTVLERFVRGEGARGAGTGLGLAIAAAQAARYGGSLTLGASPLGGLQVRVVIPSSTIGR